MGGGAMHGLMGRFSSFLMQNVSWHSSPRGILVRPTGLSSTEASTETDSRKTFERKERAMHSNSRGLTRAHLLLMWRPRGNQNLNLGRLNENKLAGPPRKQKGLSKCLKGQRWLLQRFPQRQHLSRRLGSLWRFLLPELVENARLADWSFK